MLDVGCGDGALGQALMQETRCVVVGVTHSESEAEQARRTLDHVEVADLNTFDPIALGRFDCIVCSHVLEHLLAPEQFLRRLRACLAAGGTLVIALPNVLHWRQRVEFMRGRFRYADGGLMDHTHYRFFDWQTSQLLVSGAGFRVVKRFADGGLPLSRWLGPQLGPAIDRCAVRRFPGLFGFQFVFSCGAVSEVSLSDTDPVPAAASELASTIFR